MSEQKYGVTLQQKLAATIDKEVENKRMVAWAGFGKEIYHGELQLQLQAQQIIGKLITAIPKEQITEAEAALAIVKQELSALIENRKKITARFDPPAKRLMAPEKEIEAAIEQNKAEILKAKQAREKEAKTEEAKQKELKEVAAQVRIYVVDMHSAYLNAQLKLLSDAYKYALDNAITLADLPAYTTKVKGRITIAHHTMPRPKIVAKYNDQATIDTEIINNFTPWAAQKYIETFADEIALKFADWELALKDKETAAELNNTATQQTEAAITEYKEQETVSAKLEAIAMPVSDSTEKPLKKVYKLAEASTLEDAFTIMNAFIVNKKLTVPKLRSISPENLSTKQMRAALEAIKNNDNNFEVTGLLFIQVDKL